MKSDRIKSFLTHLVAFDLETHKVQPGLATPPIVCGSIASWNSDAGRAMGRLLSLDEARDEFGRLLDDETITICGANIAYDMLCMAQDAAVNRGLDIMPRIIAAYEAGRVWDLQIAEALHAIANGHLGLDPRRGNQKLRDPITRKMGRYSLSICLDLVLGRVDAKVNDRFRFSYALLEHIPMADWPVEARVYPVDDACNTLDVTLAQAGLIPRPSDHQWLDESDAPCQICGCPLMESGRQACTPRRRKSDNVHDVARQTYAGLAMAHGAAWGFAVDVDAILSLQADTVAKRAKAIERFLELQYLRPDKKDTQKVCRNTGVIKRAVARAYGATDACAVCAGTGQVASSRTGKPVGCRSCDSSGLQLDGSVCPRTKGSKCRTCKGQRQYAAPKPASKRAALTAQPQGTIIACAQCDGQPDVIPGVAAGRDVLFESGDDDVLVPFAEYLQSEKLLTVYLPFLLRGTTDDGQVEADFDEDDDAEPESTE